MSPAELMALTGALVENVRNVSAAMKGAVATLVEDGWTEEQARELVSAMVVTGLRGTTTEPEAEGSAA